MSEKLVCSPPYRLRGSAMPNSSGKIGAVLVLRSVVAVPVACQPFRLSHRNQPPQSANNNQRYHVAFMMPAA